jgi:hypothetical protein
MIRQYTVEEDGIIWYEENGIRYSFSQDEGNADYQRYLRWLENPDAEENGTIS